MKIRMLLWSGLSASAVTLAAGAALSGPAATSPNNRIVDFNQSTGELNAYVPAGSLATYLHQPTTAHLLSDLTKYAPPDPCRPISEIWNLTVQYDQRFGVRSTFIFDALLTIMADLQCHATVTTTTVSTNTLFSMQPVAN